MAHLFLIAGHGAGDSGAVTKGYSYRLLENGFISNHEDLNKFNSQIDDLARGILKAFGITSAALVASVKKTEPVDGEIKSGGVFQSKTDKFGTISYQAHMRGFGWGNWQSDVLMVGSTGQNRRIEALHVKPDGETDVVVHMKEIGNKEYKNIKKDTLIGTTGQNRRLEAIRINPYGKIIKAKVHIQSKGWVDYGMITKDTIIGTVGEKKRIECLCFEGDFEYRVHIQSSGWADWTKADGVATLGTVGQELRIEAIQFR